MAKVSRPPDWRQNGLTLQAEALMTQARLMRERSSRVHAEAIIMREETSRMREALRLQREELARYDKNYRTLLGAVAECALMLGRNHEAVLADVLKASIAMTGADMGNIQLVNPVTGALRIGAHFGFSDPFLNFFECVHDGEAACGTALKQGERIIVEDVTKSSIFLNTLSLDIMLEAGALAVQSTPLIGPSGQILGMLSTHYCRPHRPNERDLRLLDFVARRTAAWVEYRAD